MISPALKGPLPRWCAECAAVMRREQRRERRGTQTSWTCLDCEQTFPREKFDGPVPKRCSKCRTEAQRIASSNWTKANPDQALAISRAWRVRNLEKSREATRRSMAKRREEAPEAVKRAKLRSKYKLSDDDLDVLFDQADGCCEICGVAFGEEARTRAVIDHDHRTDRVRGVLCGNCNTGLGFVRDSTKILFRLADYVENPPGIPA
jgi:hypothetical protein